MSSFRVSVAITFIGALVGLAPLTGCLSRLLGCECADSEEVLEGTWQLTGEALDPSITDFLIEFSKNGEIDGVSYKINNLIFDYRDVAITGFANVNGSDVDISAKWAVGEFFFNGTLNEANNVMQGSITYEFISGGLSIGADLGPATLTKQ